MVRKKTATRPPRQEAVVPGYLGMTPNQVVAYNLAQARNWKGWTQDEAADALAPFLGTRWSKASFSQAERSVGGKFVRNFSADEIIAFARAFELPVGWFFMPPVPWAGPGRPVALEVPPDGEQIAELVDLVFGDDGNQAILTVRLDGFLDQLGPDRLTAAQRRISALVSRRVEAITRSAFKNIGRWQTSLRSIANQLEDLEALAKHAIADESGIDPRELRG